MLYNVHTFLAFDAVGWQVTRSWRHHSGEECFGGDWFVVQADTPVGQITNHYRAEHWNLFAGIPKVETSPAWDGHTPPVAAQRLESAIPFLRKRFAQITKINGIDVTTACTCCGKCDYCQRNNDEG
jgi:hypothetical protein